MGRKISFSGQEYDLDELSAEARSAYNALTFSQSRFEELSNMVAVLTKAKRAYMEDLKQEIIMKRSGLL
jgi:hypothetical protein